MKIPLCVNVLWAVFLLIFLTAINLDGGDAQAIAIVLTSVVYLAVSIFALCTRRWAVAVTIAVPLVFAVWWDAIVIINCVMYVIGHELYQDSPATIFIVLIYAFIFALPASTVTTLFYLKRGEISQVLRRR